MVVSAIEYWTLAGDAMELGRTAVDATRIEPAIAKAVESVLGRN